MRTQNIRSRQVGVGLIELMVSVLVLSIGLVALARLQIELVRGAADSRARSAAVALAEQKLEDLRSYGVLNGAGTWSTAASPQAWSWIDDNAGGRIAAQTQELEGVSYALSWAVSEITYTTSLGPALGLPTDYKDVTVTVAWEDSDADTPTQQVQLTASIMGIPPGNVIAASEPVAERPNGPEVLYTPGEAPEIISVPIDVGDGKKRETTKPLPDVQAQSQYSHEVRFDVVNYQTIGGENVVLRREEFVTVNCRCKIGPEGPARTPARVVFEGGVLTDRPGQIVTKQTGLLNATGADGLSQQPVLCTVCCRDHFDGPVEGTDNNRYNPTAAAAHEHFLFNVGPGTYTGPVTTTNAAYDEACRLKRVNGVFQVFEDWNLNTITTLPATYLSNDSPTTQEDYIDYVQDFVQAKVEGNAPQDKNVAMPTPRDYDFDKGANRQLLGRSIYVDNMPQNLLDFLQQRIDNNEPFLEFVPFFEINATKLADWLLNQTDGSADTNQSPCPPSNAATNNAMVLCVTNETIVDEGSSQDSYSRGRTYAGQTAGARRVLSRSKLANSGLTGTFAISTTDAATTSDFVTATVNAVATTQSIGGEVDFSQCPTNLSGPGRNALYASLSISYVGPGAVSCTTGSLSGNSGSWRCDGVPFVPPSSVTVTATFDPALARDANTINPVSTSGSYSVTVDGMALANNLGFSICDVVQP